MLTSTGTENGSVQGLILSVVVPVRATGLLVLVVVVPISAAAELMMAATYIPWMVPIGAGAALVLIEISHLGWAGMYGSGMKCFRKAFRVIFESLNNKVLCTCGML